MDCYLCRMEAPNKPGAALVVCQYCGEGICEEHLIKMQIIGAASMVEEGSQSSRLICFRCYASIASKRPSHPGKPVKARYQWRGATWWGWLYRPSPDLPSPEEAVVAAEQFLRQSARY